MSNRSRPGRPRLPDHAKRKPRTTLRASKAEWREIQSAAEAMGCSVSTFLREAGLRHGVAEEDDAHRWVTLLPGTAGGDLHIQDKATGSVRSIEHRVHRGDGGWGLQGVDVEPMSAEDFEGLFLRLQPLGKWGELWASAIDALAEAPNYAFEAVDPGNGPGPHAASFKLRPTGLGHVHMLIARFMRAAASRGVFPDDDPVFEPQVPGRHPNPHKMVDVYLLVGVPVP